MRSWPDVPSSVLETAALPLLGLLFALCVVAVNTTLITGDDPRPEVWVIGQVMKFLPMSNTVLPLLESQEISNAHVPVVTNVCNSGVDDQEVKLTHRSYGLHLPYMFNCAVLRLCTAETVPTCSITPGTYIRLLTFSHSCISWQLGAEIPSKICCNAALKVF